MFKLPLVAIDIGSSAIKVVELSGHGQKKLRHIGLEVLPPGVVVDGAIQNQEVVEGTLKELLKKLKITTTGRRAALSLGGSSVIIKKINIARDSQAELAEQVYYEAEQHFQADMADIYFDFCPIAGSEKEQQVILVGTRREIVEQYIGAVRSVGMRTGVIECDVFSVSNMFEFNYGMVEGLTGIVNIGASATQVALVAGGHYLYTRDVSIGGEEYSKQIIDMLGVDRENAETLKISASHGDGNVPEDMQKLVGDLNEQLVHEIQMTVDYFFQSGEAPPGLDRLSSLFLTGGGSRILGLDAALAAALQIPVQIVNPFQRIEVNPKKFQMDYILMQGHLYGVAVGLGMRGVRDAA